MNIIYTKTILQIYAVAESVIEQLDDLAERKALASMSDFSPCFEQCEKIIDLKNQKNIILYIQKIVNKILSKLTIEQLDLLDYKYFKKKPKEYYKNFDYSSRAYFRNQIKVVLLVAEKLEKYQLNDSWFNKNCLKIEFFKEMLKRVQEKEELSNKNKPKVAKSSSKNNHNVEFCSKLVKQNKILIDKKANAINEKANCYSKSLSS